MRAQCQTNPSFIKTLFPSKGRYRVLLVDQRTCFRRRIRRTRDPESRAGSANAVGASGLPRCVFMLRPAHQQQVADILRDPQASENDKYVALQFLRNSDIAAKGVLPTCQDTGTAIIVGKKANASGLVEVMKRRWLAAYITPISKITCAIRKTRRWICTKRSIPVLTCQRRSISTASMAMNINSSVSLKAADRRIKPTSIRRQSASDAG